VKPIIVDCDSADVVDLFDYHPEDPEDFGFQLTLTIGIEGQKGADNFQLMVATPKHIQKIHPNQSAILLRHYLVVFRYDFNEILDVINKYIRSIEEDTWERVAEKIGRVAQWEFEDYKPYQPY
jgi:23S rRNA maturation-related 3'-5' exoribonuclease YhaM